MVAIWCFVDDSFLVRTYRFLGIRLLDLLLDFDVLLSRNVSGKYWYFLRFLCP
jgi:hypothetical protein